MRKFNVQPTDKAIVAKLQNKVDNLTKPKGSLGVLEDMAIQIGAIQQSLCPTLNTPHHVVFAADHGIAEEGVSFSPQEVTRQMVLNFQQGGAGINFFARQHRIALEIVDVGVNTDFSELNQPLVDNKIAKGTRNYLNEAAMSIEELNQAIEYGAESSDHCCERGCNIISFGEMGITNTSSSSIWMSYLTGIELRECIGAGSDHTGGIVEHKCDVLGRAVERFKSENIEPTPIEIMRQFGGFEMVAAVGAMLRAAELNMVVIIDGFIMTACALMAATLQPNFVDYAIYGHCGDEAGHKKALEHLNAKPLLNLGLRLGEGTGALCAYPIIDSSIRMINEMSSFEQQDVTKYF